MSSSSLRVAFMARCQVNFDGRCVKWIFDGSCQWIGRSRDVSDISRVKPHSLHQHLPQPPHQDLTSGKLQSVVWTQDMFSYCLINQLTATTITRLPWCFLFICFVDSCHIRADGHSFGLSDNFWQCEGKVLLVESNHIVRSRFDFCQNIAMISVH